MLDKLLPVVSSLVTPPLQAATAAMTIAGALPRPRFDCFPTLGSEADIERVRSDATVALAMIGLGRHLSPLMIDGAREIEVTLMQSRPRRYHSVIKLTMKAKA